MTKLVYWLFYLISLLPLRVLYCVADFEYLVVYYVLRYRRKLVRKHLTTAFPEKDIKEIKRIEKKFFRWLCDYFLEAIKLLSISEKELRRRFIVTNADDLEECFKNGQSVGSILGHHCNWEWLSCITLYLPKERKAGLIYKGLRSDAMDNVFYKLRSHVGGQPILRKEILRYLVKYRKEGIMSIFGYIADQGPRWENIHLWLDFLNHETGVFTGAERIMRKMNNAVFYVEMDRPKRGYYTCTFHLITKDPNSWPEHGITKEFFKRLEQTIRRKPEYYLWTHNRWKRTREEFERRFVVEHGKVVRRVES